MNLNLENTVKDVAVGVPGATRVFEKLGIDYCCGGHRSLADACRLANLEGTDVLRSLAEAESASQNVSGERNWQNETLASLTGFIVETHHTFTRDELARIELLLDKVCSVHGQNHAELLTVQKLFLALRDDLLPHMLKEEKILFPYVTELEGAILNGTPLPMCFFGTVQNPVRMMMNEHDTAGDLLRQLRSLTNDYTAPADGCFSYRTLYQALEAFETDLHQHIHLENNILFPRAVEMESGV